MQTFKYLIIQSRFLHHFIHHFCVVLHHFTISYDTLTKSTIHATRLRILYLQGFLTFCKFKNKEFDKFLLITFHLYKDLRIYGLLNCLKAYLPIFPYIRPLARHCRRPVKKERNHSIFPQFYHISLLYSIIFALLLQS